MASKIFTYTRNCAICNTEFTSTSPKSKSCSEECRKEQIKKKMRDFSRRKFLESEESSKEENFIICKICNLKLKSLSGHVSRQHQISIKEYKKLYPGEKIVCDTTSDIFSDNFSGSRNPGYKHNGVLSPWSEKSGRSTSEIEASKQKAKDNRPANPNLPIGKQNTSLEFYIQKGFSEEEAKVELAKRQTTFSLGICIEKHR